MRIHVPMELRWSDIDAYSHVNNVAMLRLLEEARIRAFWSTGGAGTGGDAGTDADAGADAGAGDDAGAGAGDEAPVGPAVLDGRPGSATLSFIAQQQAQYLRPITYQREPLDIELWIGRIGGSSVQVCYEVYSPAGTVPRTLFTRAESTLVLADAATSAPRRISEAERAAWQPYVEDPIDLGRRS